MLLHDGAERERASGAEEPVNREFSHDGHIGLDLHAAFREARAHEGQILLGYGGGGDDALTAAGHAEVPFHPPRLREFGRRRSAEERARLALVGDEYGTRQRGPQRRGERARIHAQEHLPRGVGLGLRARATEESKRTRRGTERSAHEPARAERRGGLAEENVIVGGEERRRQLRREPAHRVHDTALRRISPERDGGSRRDRGELQIGVEVQNPGESGCHASSSPRNRSLCPALRRASRWSGLPRISIGDSGEVKERRHVSNSRADARVSNQRVPKRTWPISSRPMSSWTRAPSSSPASRNRAAKDAVCSRFALSTPRPIVATNATASAQRGTRSQNQSRTVNWPIAKPSLAIC